MNFKTLALAATVLGAATLSGQAYASTNLIMNGGFETGDFTDWTLSGSSSDAAVVTSGNYTPLSGSYYADLKTPGNAAGYLEQSYSDVANQTYNITFWYNSSDSNNNALTVLYDGLPIFSDKNFKTSGWTEFTTTVVGSGGVNADNLQFSFKDTGGHSIGLDVISVAAGVPEPSTWAMLGLGFTALGFAASSRGRRDRLSAA